MYLDLISGKPHKIVVINVWNELELFSQLVNELNVAYRIDNLCSLPTP